MWHLVASRRRPAPSSADEQRRASRGSSDERIRYPALPNGILGQAIPLCEQADVGSTQCRVRA